MAVPDRAPAEAVAGGIRWLDPVPPVAMVLAAAVSVQFGAALGATLFDELGPGGASLLRQAFAAAILLALWRPRVRSYRWPELRLALAFGVALGLMNLFFYEALDRIPLGVAVTIEFLGPLVVAVISSHRRLDLVWIALAGGGIALLADPNGHLDVTGVVLAAVAAVFWGVYIVLGVRMGRVWPGASGLGVAMVVGAALSIPSGIASGRGDLLHPGVLGAGIVVALACSAVPWSMEIEAMRRLPTHVFGVMMSLEPAVAALSGLVVLGERLSGRVVVSIAIVCVASVGAALGARDPEVPVDA
jgi:inner membrane transporter RhtA